jgi:DNA-binding beta-propeller fold protein YncE
LATPYGAFGIAVDEEHQEMMLTVQHSASVVTFRKMAQGEESPIRLLQGDHTHLADPHGIALDPKHDEIFVANFGEHHLIDLGLIEPGSGPPTAEGPTGVTRPRKPNWPVGVPLEGGRGIVPGTGQFLPPSITVHSRTASGDTPPLRVIEGPKTQLDWPTGIAVDPERGEIYVANDVGDSVLVFNATASGDVARFRVIKGPHSKIKNPTGVRLDLKNGELWTANFGNHTATVHPLGASGDALPLRTIRSAPIGQPTPSMSNPHAIAYDNKRDQILVPS